MPAASLQRVPEVEAVPHWTRVSLDDRVFADLVRLVKENCGIALSDMKRTMLETRLRRRLMVNDIADFGAYATFLRSDRGRREEMQFFVDAVVTNQTSFFRELNHFEHLTPAELKRLAKEGNDGSLKIWSAACSSGEEAWSLAMIADEASRGGNEFPWKILATDISIRILTAARDAIYTVEDVAAVPERLRQAYLMRSRDPEDRRVKIAPELRRNVRFGQINLMDADYRPGSTMDLIFCRNVLIYFEPDVQLQVVAKLCRHLRPGGLLILGHSDTVRSKALPLRLIRGNIYERLREAPR